MTYATVDTGRLTLGEKLAGVSAAALAIFMCYTWFADDEPLGISSREFAERVQQVLSSGGNSLGIKSTYTGWDLFGLTTACIILTIVLTLLYVGFAATGRRSRHPLSLLVAGAGFASTLLIVHRILIPPGGFALRLGIFLGVAAAAGIAAGGCLAAITERRHSTGSPPS
jgi:hypothetical protein